VSAHVEVAADPVTVAPAPPSTRKVVSKQAKANSKPKPKPKR
jgi:hypothetical protein